MRRASHRPDAIEMERPVETAQRNDEGRVELVQVPEIDAAQSIGDVVSQLVEVGCG